MLYYQYNVYISFKWISLFKLLFDYFSNNYSHYIDATADV